MKKFKKLIPAFCMLLISAVLMGTSTFAWFSMNSEVTAGALTIKATTDANLFIANGASVELDAITGTSVDNLNVSANAVKPCELTDADGTVTVKDVATYTTNPTVGTAGTAATYTNIGTITNTAKTNETGKDVGNYVAVGFVTIARKQTTAGTYKITPVCTVNTASASNLNKALRAGLIINGVLYESNDADSAGTEISFTFNDVTGLADNTAYSVALLLWFEGEDTDCTANNAVSLSQNTANWTFTSAAND
mgnify:CR=1 FL=1